MNLFQDIYYRKSYRSLYLDHNSELFTYEYREGGKRIIFSSIKRKICNVAGITIDDELYDLETPYGYGGPVSNCYEEKFLNAAFTAYREECKNNNIVSEFIRFHPFNNLSQYSRYFDYFSKDRDIIVVDLSLEDRERWSKYSKSTRNILRKANRKLKRVRNEGLIGSFYYLYEETMDKNKADDFYYFDKRYFEKLLKIDGVDLLTVMLGDSIVSQGIFMYGPDICHYHLSANNGQYTKENGNYVLLDYAFDNAKDKGCKWMMLGGGRTADMNDGLFKFKSKFSDQYKSFYIAGLNFLPEVKLELNTLWRSQNKNADSENFQLYRF